jgi:DNA-binding beta-propeller fold protein YncE
MLKPCARWAAVVLAFVALSACAPVGKRTAASGKDDPLVYPGPPDEPRFAFERMIVNSASVTGFSEQDVWKAKLTGSQLAGEGMVKPYAVAVHQGRIFVSDTADRAVKVFDMPEQRYFRITDTATGAMRKPLGLDVDAQGNLYVADGTDRVIYVFDRNGAFLKQIGDGKQFDRLSSVTVNPEGTKVYAVDIGGVRSENHRVRVFDAQTGGHLMDIGKRGTANGEFNLPRDLAVGRDGRLYVVDGGNFRIQVFDREGRYMNSFGKVGKQLGDFARPKEIAIDAEGNVYVADAAFGNFQIFSPDGELLMFVGQRSETNGPAKYMLPAGLFVDEDGRIYMVDQWFKKVDVFRPYALPVGGGFFSKAVAQPTPGKAGGK